MKSLLSSSSACTIFHGQFLALQSTSFFFFFKRHVKQEKQNCSRPADCWVSHIACPKNDVGSCNRHCHFLAELVLRDVRVLREFFFARAGWCTQDCKKLTMVVQDRCMSTALPRTWTYLTLSVLLITLWTDSSRKFRVQGCVGPLPSYCEWLTFDHVFSHVNVTERESKLRGTSTPLLCLAALSREPRNSISS